ncbi:MAG: YihY/virulence factor BrkB family protein [Thermoleophilaceae bacterium]
MAIATRRLRRPSLPSVPGGLRKLVDEFERNDLLTSASAIAFQILTTIVPFALFLVSLAGFLNLGSLWRDEIAPKLHNAVSGPAYQVINDTVTKALSSRQAFWLTFGALLALWQLSGAVRAAMGALNRVYDVRAERSWRERIAVSVAIALGQALCLIGALAVVTLTPLLYGDVGQPLGALLFAARWGAAALLLLACVWMLVRYGPASPRPVRWVSFGSGLVVAGWVLMSIGFGVYLRAVADYGSIFGNLASLVVLLTYLYLSAIVFLGGAQIDSLVRSEALRRD